MITDVVAKWELHMRGRLPGGLDELLADDVVFYSPIVYTPQVGKELTTLYLTAAAATFPGDESSSTSTSERTDTDTRSFHYTKKVMSGDTAVLEFETSMNGAYVNGVDIIRCNDQGQIVEFRVMIRPLKAVNQVHANMKAMLERMGQTF